MFFLFSVMASQEIYPNDLMHSLVIYNLIYYPQTSLFKFFLQLRTHLDYFFYDFDVCYRQTGGSTSKSHPPKTAGSGAGWMNFAFDDGAHVREMR